MGKRAVRELKSCAALDAFHDLVVVGNAFVVGIAFHTKPDDLVGHGIYNRGAHLTIRIENEHRIGRRLDCLDDVVSRRRPRRIAVDLIAVQVRHDEHLRVHCRQEGLRGTLVAFDDGPIVLTLAAQGAIQAKGGCYPLLEVRARRVVCGAAERVYDRLLHHMRCRRLAVRACYDDGFVALAELADDVAVNDERQLSGHGAGSAPHSAHHTIRGFANADCKRFPQRHVLSLFAKEQLIPADEDVYCPNIAPQACFTTPEPNGMRHARLFTQKGIEQSADLVHVEELGCNLACKRAANVGVDRRIGKPFSHWNGKSELLAIGDLVR